MNNIYSQELLELMEQTTIDVNRFEYTVYYTNTCYNTLSFAAFIELAKLKFQNDNLIIAVAESEPSNSTITTSHPNVKVVRDFNVDLPNDWSNVFFFNFTLLVLRPRLFRVKHCVINYIAEDNLSLIKYARLRDKHTLVLNSVMRPEVPKFNVNDYVLPYRVVLDYIRDQSTSNSRLKILIEQQREFQIPIGNFLPSMSVFQQLGRFASNVYKNSIQLSFKNPIVLIYTYSNMSFNAFLADLYREELWLTLLFEWDKNNIIDAKQVCEKTPLRPFFLKLVNLPIFPKISDDDYIEWQLWILYLYRLKNNLMTSLPCELSVVARPFVTDKYPCVTINNIDGLVVNSLCTSSDFMVII